MSKPKNFLISMRANLFLIKFCSEQLLDLCYEIVSVFQSLFSDVLCHDRLSQSLFSWVNIRVVYRKGHLGG